MENLKNKVLYIIVFITIFMNSFAQNNSSLDEIIQNIISNNFVSIEYIKDDSVYNNIQYNNYLIYKKNADSSLLYNHAYSENIVLRFYSNLIIVDRGFYIPDSLIIRNMLDKNYIDINKKNNFCTGKYNELLYYFMKNKSEELREKVNHIIVLNNDIPDNIKKIVFKNSNINEFDYDSIRQLIIEKPTSEGLVFLAKYNRLQDTTLFFSFFDYNIEKINFILFRCFEVFPHNSFHDTVKYLYNNYVLLSKENKRMDLGLAMNIYLMVVNYPSEEMSDLVYNSIRKMGGYNKRNNRILFGIAYKFYPSKEFKKVFDKLQYSEFEYNQIQNDFLDSIQIKQIITENHRCFE